MNTKELLQQMLGLTLVVLLLAGCSTVVQPAQAVPGEKIILSQNLQIERVPQSVIPYGGGQSLTLADLELNKDDSLIAGSVQFQMNQDDEFTLVVYITTPEQLLVIYFDPDTDMYVTTPAGSRGDAAIGGQGYELKDGENAGTIEFSFSSELHGTYDIDGMSGRVFVFCVKLEERLDLEAFQAISNVVEVKMDF